MGLFQIQRNGCFVVRLIGLLLLITGCGVFQHNDGAGTASSAAVTLGDPTTIPGDFKASLTGEEATRTKWKALAQPHLDSAESQLFLKIMTPAEVAALKSSESNNTNANSTSVYAPGTDCMSLTKDFDADFSALVGQVASQYPAGKPGTSQDGYSTNIDLGAFTISSGDVHQGELGYATRYERRGIKSNDPLSQAGNVVQATLPDLIEGGAGATDQQAVARETYKQNDEHVHCEVN